MNVLVACEFSGIVRDAFDVAGHNAISCDLLPTESEMTRQKKLHAVGDVATLLSTDAGWDLVIAHPPCTRLANSGVRWLHERNLWDDLEDACEFFNMFREFHEETGVPVAVENPIPHKYAVDKIGKYDQIIQPWQFGHGETKAICLWLFGLPELKPTNIVKGRKQRVWRMPPGKDRAKERSRFYPGIAQAMADRWG